MYLKLEIRVVCRYFLAFRYEFIVFFKTNHMIIYICTSEILKKLAFKTGFSVHNIHFLFVWASREY